MRMRTMTAREATRSVWTAPGMPALLLMVASGFAGYSLLLPVAPLWAAHGGADEAGVGWVTGVFMFCTVAAQLFVPRALRGAGWTPVLATGMVLLGAPTLLHSLSDALAPTLVIAAVRGAGFAVLTVAGSSAVAELVEPERRGRAIGAFGLAIAGPQVVLVPLAPWIAEHVGFAVVFGAASVPLLGVVPAIRLGRRLDRRPTHAAPEHADLAGGTRRFAGLVAPVVLLLGVTIAGGALLTFAPQFGVDAGAALVALLLFTGLAALTRWGIGHLSDRVGPARILWLFVLACVAGLALVAWAVAAPGRAVGIVLGMALVGIAYGALQNLTMGLAFASVRRTDQIVASAAWNIGFDAGTGIGAVAVGALATGYGFPTALVAASVVSALTLPIAIFSARRPARR